MPSLKTALATIALLAPTQAARAEEWVDYAPTAEPWEVTTVKVESTKLDDYLVSLKKSLVAGLEQQKKDGVVAEYHILVNTSPGAAGATVVFLTKFKDWAALAPNKERDLKDLAEFRKTFTKSAEDKLGEDRSKFRSFLDQGIYGDVTYLK